MNWLQLLASLVDSLAWPVTVGVAVYLLRKPLLELLPNLRQFKYKDLEVQFGEGLERLEQELERRAPPKRISPESDLQRAADEEFDLLVAVSPNAAVLDAWTDIERKLRILGERQDILERRGRSVLYLTRVLRSREIISSRLASLIDDLRSLRNVAAHPTAERQITLIEARRYKEIVDQVGDELQSLLE